MQGLASAHSSRTLTRARTFTQDKEVKELEQILASLDKYHPTIPDSVTGAQACGRQSRLCTRSLAFFYVTQMCMERVHILRNRVCPEYYLRKTGFHTTDARVTRLVSLAAQKFIADVRYTHPLARARTRTLAHAHTKSRVCAIAHANTQPARADRTRSATTSKDEGDAREKQERSTARHDCARHWRG